MVATADQEITITFFANPFLKCDTCGKRAVGYVGQPTLLMNLVTGLLTQTTTPTNARNWPCFDISSRTSVCTNWTSTTGCQHDMPARAQHSNVFGYEGTRR